MVTLGQGRRKFLVCIEEKNLYFCCSLWISLERDLKYNRHREIRSSEQKGRWREKWRELVRKPPSAWKAKH